MPAAEPRWLSLEDQVIWRNYHRATMEVRDALERDLLDAFGLSLNEYEVLVVLSEQEGRTIRMSALADSVINSRSRLTHTIRRMESRNLVQRTSCAEDGRGVNCAMTDEGWQLLVEAAPIHVESVRAHIFDRLTRAETDSLGGVVAKLGNVDNAAASHPASRTDSARTPESARTPDSAVRL